MPKLITVYWRDIPAQVIARSGRGNFKVPLTQRFHEAIDRAAMRAGRGSSDKYLEDWRRASRNVAATDLQALARDEASRLEDSFDDARLEVIIKAGGKDPAAADSASPAAPAASAEG